MFGFLADVESSLVIAIVALIISGIALVYTIKTYILKSGDKFRCDVTTANSKKCTDIFISSITLENLKDKASVIFSIYYKFGRNIYLELERFEQSPLILAPFEVYHKKYSPTIGYSTNTYKVNLNHLFARRKRHEAIVLSTSTGRHTIRTGTKRWYAISSYFRNGYTEIILPIRLSYNKKGYGDNTKYIVRLRRKHENDEIIPIYEYEYEVKFKNFGLTKESLISAKELKRYFKQQKSSGHVHFDSIEVIDFSRAVRTSLETYKHGGNVHTVNWIRYNVLGRIYSRMGSPKIADEEE